MTDSSTTSRSASEKLSYLFATGLYFGRSPVMPGTCGTLSMYLITLLAYKFEPRLGTLPISCVSAILMSVLSVWLIDRVLAAGFFANTKDPQQIVIDEWAGFLVTAIGHGTSPLRLALCFLMFRVFDMTKPPPIKRLEALPGGLGITADDLLAGVYANITVWVIAAFLNLQ